MSKAKKKTAPRKASTALAVRPKAKPVPRLRITGMPAPDALVPVGQLGELATVGALGLAELKLTPAEEQVLARPVDPRQILLKPARTGEPPSIPYLPHIVYTRWFNDAFGRTGWSIVPTAAPKKVDNLVLVPYLLYIHGIPVAAATGEQEYIEKNRQQTYGDVIESTVASALRRCAKRLGVGLEMWDKAWLEANVRAVKAAKTVGRNDGPIEAEVVEERPPADDRKGINKGQQDRLFEIAERTGRNPAEVSMWLRRVYGVRKSAEILQKDYADIVRQLEARGELPFPGDGQ